MDREGVLGAQVDGGGALRFTSLQHHGVLHKGILVENGHVVEQAAAVDMLAGLGPQGGEQLPLPKPLRTRRDLAVQRGLNYRDPEDAAFVVDGRGIHEHQGPLVPEVEFQRPGIDLLHCLQIERLAEVMVSQEREQLILMGKQVDAVDIHSGINREPLGGFLGMKRPREHDLAQDTLAGMTDCRNLGVVRLDLEFRRPSDERVGGSLRDAVGNVLADGGIGRELGHRPVLSQTQHGYTHGDHQIVPDSRKHGMTPLGVLLSPFLRQCRHGYHNLSGKVSHYHC